jgi:predicted nuclease of predicted toxin-antitoxin system
MNLLLDESVPVGVRGQLPGHTVQTVPELGWAGLGNGDLLDAAERAGFDMLITGDRNLVHQQSLLGRKIAVVVTSTNYWPTIKEHPDLLPSAVAGTRKGDYVVVPFTKPPRRRRPYPPPTP